MKTLIYPIIVSLFLCNSLYAKERDDSTSTKINKKIGLVAYLTQVKLKAENTMFIHLKKNNDSASIATIEAYNSVRLCVDALINQLSADMVVSNKLSVYKKLNNYLKGDDTTKISKKISQYKPLISRIDSVLENMETKMEKESAVSTDLLGVILDFANAIHGVITDARDFRAKKIESLNSQLDKLRLEKLETKKKEEKEESKK